MQDLSMFIVRHTISTVVHCRYFGILNGIDTVMWNPSVDVFLPAKFHGTTL